MLLFIRKPVLFVPPPQSLSTGVKQILLIGLFATSRHLAIMTGTYRVVWCAK